jgi:D-beta-D-heptose 7-phosphate kinase/D-beta-D-heptose 1-phosphate adenosyltransferase
MKIKSQPANSQALRGLSVARTRKLLAAAGGTRILVLGDVMLDHFLWGKVGRISPEAPVPVVEFERESFIPGGAGNVARNLADLRIGTELFGMVGCDASAALLRQGLEQGRIGCGGLLAVENRMTSVKTRIIAHRQQIVRVDRESRLEIDRHTMFRLLASLEESLKMADAVVLCDYAKGVITQQLLNKIKELCRRWSIWLSVDPKPSHRLNLSGVSLLTPNRKEAFELASIPDGGCETSPAGDAALLRVADKLLARFQPELLLITLGDQGMLLCQRGRKPFHVPTMAREVFDVSGAGDTAIASFTFAMAAGATPVEAAIFSNHAAGVVVGKLGTATVSPEELLGSIRRKPRL